MPWGRRPHRGSGFRQRFWPARREQPAAFGDMARRPAERLDRPAMSRGLARRSPPGYRRRQVRSQSGPGTDRWKGRAVSGVPRPIDLPIHHDKPHWGCGRPLRDRAIPWSSAMICVVTTQYRAARPKRRPSFRANGPLATPPSRLRDCLSHNAAQPRRRNLYAT